MSQSIKSNMIAQADMREIREALNRIEDKLDDRISTLEIRTNSLESKLANIMGKAAIGFIVMMSVFGIAVAALVDWVKGIGK